MPRLFYNNYFVGKLNSKFKSNFAFVDAQKVRQAQQYMCRYTLNIDEISISRQAIYFAQYFTAAGYFRNSFLDNSNRLEQVIELVADTYKYSYYKCVYYSLCYALKLPEGAFIKENSLVFKGHKELYDNICHGYMIYHDLNNSNISFQIDVSLDLLDNLKQIDFVNDVLRNSSDNSFFDSRFETILHYMFTNCSDVIHLEVMHRDVFTSYDILSNPIGNTCFSNNRSNICYIETDKIDSDRASFFWGLAVCLEAVYIPEVDINDEVYDDTLTSRYDVQSNVNFEVYSITGFTTLKYRDSATFGNSYNPNTNNSNSGPNSYLGPNDGNNPGSNRRGDQSNFGVSSRGKKSYGVKTKNTNTNNNNSTMFVEQVKRFTGPAISLLKEEYVTDDNIDRLRKLIFDATRRSISQSILRSSLGKRVSSFLSDNDLKLSSKFSTEEMDQLILEPIGHQQYRVQPVRMLIKGK